MNQITLALPSKGTIAEPTYSFLKDCGLSISKPNPRQYTGTIPAIPGVNLLFQRVKDIVYKVSDGTAHIGITGLDVVEEHPHEDLFVIHHALGYGHCNLLVAVPEAWVDVETMADIAEIAIDFRERKGRNLRIATTYTYLTRQFFHSQGIHHFTMVRAEGAIEAAPTLGYADIIVDITQTGTTLRENHLKIIEDSIMVESQACLIGNRRVLRNDHKKLDSVRILLEHFDAAIKGRKYYQVTVDVAGDSPANVAQKVASNPITRGLLGPTVAPMFSADEITKNNAWYTVTIIVSHKNLLKAVEHLRTIGARQAVVTPVRYVFMEESPTFSSLLEKLGMS